MRFTPLHVHSHYSLLDGLAKIDDIVNKAKENGMEAVALTDHGVMYGVIEFYQKCKAAGIKPIIGIEAYVVKDRKIKDVAEEKRFHLILLAKNNQGYKNLIKLSSLAHLEGFYYKPRIDFELLKKYGEGLIAMTACLQGELPRSILDGGTEEQQEEIIKKYQAVFGAENYYLEVMHNPNIPEQKVVNNRLFELGKKLNIPIVATNDSHYLNTEDAEAHDILLCLQTKRTITEKQRMCMLGEDFSFFTQAQMADNFRGNPEVIENTNKIAEQCNVEIELGQTLLPHIELPEGKTDFQYLKDLCYQNIERRFHFDFNQNLSEENQKVIDRLEYELGIIEKTGFASYFLIVQDFINWAKNNGIVVGPGRGSAAGSLVSYLINITNLDPIKYDLLFERFLNPARISMPDIDTDFADIRRDEVIHYVEEKYGKDHVAQIITFGTMAARAALRDVGRVLEMPYTFCDKVAKLFPMNMGLEEALNKLEEIKALYKSNEDAKRLIDFAKKLEGVARHASTHACGIVITDKEVDEYCPRQYARDQEEAIVTQYSLHPVEDIGLLKMDFLGLKNLTIIETTCEIIEKMTGRKINIDDIPLDDQKSYKLFQEGKTTGVFQFESSGMKRYLKMLAPTDIEDLIAMVSLYRPGPMDLIPDYINRKHGRQTVTYVHPKLKDTLGKTYGIAIYQEQVMQMARDLAGFSLGEADVLRKAMGKKIASLLAEQKEKFVKGCIENGSTKEVGEKVFAFIEPFAGYGFNRSHAACYALIAYQTAYLKANYPAQFMASLLTADQHNMDRIAIEIDECKQMGIEIMAPDINESFSIFTVVLESLKEGKPRIRFGLTAIRNVGEGVAKAIIHERKANGPYASLEDFLSRLTSKDLNKKSLEGLVKSGGLDLFGERSQLLENMGKMLLYVKEEERAKTEKQIDIFSLNSGGERVKPKLVLQPATTVNQNEKLGWEKEFLGLYVSDHPYKNFEKRLGELVESVSALKEQGPQKRQTRCGGIVSTVKKIMTKKGDPMLFVGLEDGFNSLELLVFPRLYKEKADLFESGAVLIVEGTISDKDDEVKILCNEAWRITEENFEQTVQAVSRQPIASNEGYSNKNGYRPRPAAPRVVIDYPLGATKELANQIKMLFMTMEGKFQVFLQIEDKLIKTDFRINLDQEAKQKIEAVLGEGAIKRA